MFKVPIQYYSHFCEYINTRNTNNIPLFKVKHNFFRNSFFPSAVIEWNKLDLNIRISERFNIFKKTRLNLYVLLEALFSIATIPKDLSCYLR